MTISIPDAIRQMLAIVHALQQSHPKKKFTLDGRLVGDLGEVLVEGAYDVTLFEDLQKHHDGVTSDGRKVQIKATMKNSLTFPGDHIPDYYLGIKIHEDGAFTEIFNGPGKVAWEAIRGRKALKTNLHSIGITPLKQLNLHVDQSMKIPRRKGADEMGVKRKDVVGALILKGGKILLAQRSCADLDGKWEFPGGKVEPGETHQEALRREILEELGVPIAVSDRAASNDFNVGDKRYSLHCYWAEIVSGEPSADEHHTLAWVLPRDLLTFDLAPADIPIAKEVIKRGR